MRFSTASFVLSTLLAGAGTILAQTPAAPPAPPQSAASKAPHMTGGPMMGEKAESGSMKAECTAMMARRHARMDEMKAMDARLESLVKVMNEATGDRKVDATAAVVTELVAQRKVMRDAMESMQPQMMGHMMKHMQMGTDKDAAARMAGCPMMNAGAQKSHTHESK